MRCCEVIPLIKTSVLKRILAVLLLFLTIPAYGNVRLVFDSSSLDFGSRPLGGSREIVFNASDTSATDDIQVDAIQSVGTNAGDFIVESLTPFVIAHGAKIPTQIRVKFSPQAIGTKNATLSIQTTDGDVFISMTGIGTGESSILTVSPSSIDFGKIAPGDFRDSMVWLASVGLDSATVSALQVTNPDGSNTFQVWFADATLKTPFKLAPGDSVQIIVQFNGESLGDASGSLVVYGGSEATPTCGFGGTVVQSAMVFNPPSVDFGIIRWGDFRDTVVHFTNTGEVDVVVSDIEPLQDIEFTILNPLSLPFRIKHGQSFDFTIRAAPAIGQMQAAQLQVGSPASQPFFHYLNLSFTIDGSMPLSAPSTQSTPYFCAFPGPISITVPVTDTGRSHFAVSGIKASDTNIQITSDVALPRDVAVGETVPFNLHFDPALAIGSGKVIVEFVSGGGIVLYDTVLLDGKLTTATTNLAVIQQPDPSRIGLNVLTQTALAPFGLDTIVVHVSSSNPSLAAVDRSSIKLATGVQNASIVSIAPETGGYAVTIASTTPFTAVAGDAFVTFNVVQYVSVDDSASIRLAVESPERAGCIDWVTDSVQVPGSSACGAEFMRDVLAGTQIVLSAIVKANPVSGDNVNVTVMANKEGDVSFELSSPLGQTIARAVQHVSSGTNTVSIPLNGLPSGPYFIRLVSSDGLSRNLRFIKQD